MILLTDPEGAGRPPRVIAVFGAGLIGSAVVAAARVADPLREEILPLCWLDAALQARQLAEIAGRIVAVVERGRPGASGTLRVLWSAGKAGFYASEQETLVELANFTRVLRAVEGIRQRCPHVTTAFVLVSSAGGVFEGQRYVGPQTLPGPQRPYGLLKLQQEELLCAADAAMAKRIYRLSSVYGYIRPQHRQGLIPTLILNGLRQKVCHIYARMTTLRDFVWIEDVARYLAQVLLEDVLPPVDLISVLACGKPSSVLEIQGVVEKTIGRKLQVAYAHDAPNSEDITFAPGVLPPGWQPSEQALNIRRVFADAISRGTVFERTGD